LAAGHQVTAFVRTPARLGIEHPYLNVVQGDVMDAAAVSGAVRGQDAVISALGPSRPPAPGMMETAARNIVAAMKEHGVRRLITTTGAGVRFPEDQPKLVDNLFGALLKLTSGDVLKDSAANVEAINHSGLDWTVVRFPRLTDGPQTGNYRVSYVGKDSGTQISRADAADFILRELAEGKWVRKAPVVSY
jgi:putative NADH-flavin reductase